MNGPPVRRIQRVSVGRVGSMYTATNAATERITRLCAMYSSTSFRRACAMLRGLSCTNRSTASRAGSGTGCGSRSRDPSRCTYVGHQAPERYATPGRRRRSQPSPSLDVRLCDLPLARAARCPVRGRCAERVARRRETARPRCGIALAPSSGAALGWPGKGPVLRLAGARQEDSESTSPLHVRRLEEPLDAASRGAALTRTSTIGVRVDNAEMWIFPEQYLARRQGQQH